MTIEADSIATITTEGSAELKADINSKHISFFGKGNSKTILKGRTDYLNVNTIDKATFIGNELQSREGKLTNKGSCDVYINTAETLTIDASENSETYIFNKPQIIIENLFGKAVLRKKEKMGLIRL